MSDQMPSPEPVWWTIRSDYLLEMMYRTAGGEDVNLVYLEMYANSDHEGHGKDE